MRLAYAKAPDTVLESRRCFYPIFTTQDSGVTLVVTDANLWDDFGTPVVGKTYELTDTNNNQIKIDIFEAVGISPGVEGHFQFEYLGQLTSVINLNTPALDDHVLNELKHSF